MKITSQTILFVLILTALTGCAKVGPNYEKPQVETVMQETWNQPEDPALVPSGEDIKQWWNVFNDPELTELILIAGEKNHDMRIAVSRVNEARARLGIAEGNKAPVVNVGGDVMRNENSKNLGYQSGAQTRHTVGVDASWEIDLFGKISRTTEAAGADLQVSEEDRTDVMISLYAEVAKTYLSLRTYQARLAAADGNIQTQKGMLKLTQSKFIHGLSTDLDVAQAERVLANSEADVPPLRIELARSINTLGILIGQPPNSLWEQLKTVKPIPLPPEKVTVGIPANLLRQRPDIRRSERQLAAQTARIGVATADLYPTFSLVGSFGFSSLNAGDLLNPASQMFSLGPSFRWNIFDRDRIRNQIKVEDDRTDQALIIYERTILNALNEVENSMTAFLEQRIQAAALIKSVSASKRALTLSTKLYKDGLSDFQNVLDAQRALFDVDNKMAAAEGEAVINLVALYKALGGGWDPDQINN